SSATLEHLRSVTPDGERLDHRRFRMLVEVEGCDVHEEDTWAGRRVRIGGATVQVIGPVPRCVVTNENPDSGAVILGMYATVDRPGGISLGDPVELLDETADVQPA
ncbi:MAG: hypothetical protein JWR62_3297, partial [Modestobacter sp.]|nr:hypothetical protein [Modestobacter sp.]